MTKQCEDEVVDDKVTRMRNLRMNLQAVIMRVSLLSQTRHVSLITLASQLRAQSLAWREHVDDWIDHFPDEPPQPEEDSAKSDLKNYWAEPAAPVGSSVAMLTTAASTAAI